MDLKWNLDSLYKSLNSEEFNADKKLLGELIEKLSKWVMKNFENTERAAHKLEEFLKLYNEYKSLYSLLTCYANLKFNEDNTNDEALDILDSIDDMDLGTTEVFIKFISWLNSLKNMNEILESSSYIREHNFYLKELLNQSKYLLSEEAEIIIGKMQTTGAREWQQTYMKITSTASIEVEIEGEKEKLSLAELRNMAYEKDKDIRKAAYLAEEECCRSISQLSAACLNGISGEAITVYNIRGYKSPLDKVLSASRMDRTTLDAMMGAIKESLPVFHKYYKKKAEILGYKNNLPFYDIFAPLEDENQKLSYSDARAIIVSSFKKFSKDLGEFAEKVFEEKWIDTEQREGKGNYGLCVDIFPINESRILTNFTGNYNDVVVIAHEIGHAYHSYCLRDESMLNTDYPTPIAESASIFSETLVNSSMLNTLANKEKSAGLEKSISDIGYYIVDFYGRYNFEKKLYDRRKSGQLTVEELNQLMVDCMKEAYGDGIDPKTIHPYMWMNKIGYYMVDNEFLNFPYSFGVLFAKGLYAEYLKSGSEFVEKYEYFLSSTSKNSIVDAAGLMGIDVQSIDFWRASLNIIKEDIESFIQTENN